jgi:hypothetical protein
MVTAVQSGNVCSTAQRDDLTWMRGWEIKTVFWYCDSWSSYDFNIFSAAISASCTQSPMPMPL